MEKKINLLIYEKEIKLNLILKEQISKSGIYQVYAATKEKETLELLKKIEFDVLILNLNDLNPELLYIDKNYKTKKYNNILGYYNQKHSFFPINDLEIKAIKKPFKIINFLRELQKLHSSNGLEKKDIFLMNHIKFTPYKRLLHNLKTNEKEHLTEKENKLLLHFYINKNVEITKNDLLSVVWGLSESINTHTLETHIYRLKQKINKLEPVLSFSLSNQNSLYSMQFDPKFLL